MGGGRAFIDLIHFFRYPIGLSFRLGSLERQGANM
jgi:hypothetical protein